MAHHHQQDRRAATVLPPARASAGHTPLHSACGLRSVPDVGRRCESLRARACAQAWAWRGRSEGVRACASRVNVRVMAAWRSVRTEVAVLASAYQARWRAVSARVPSCLFATPAGGPARARARRRRRAASPRTCAATPRSRGCPASGP